MLNTPRCGGASLAPVLALSAVLGAGVAGADTMPLLADAHSDAGQGAQAFGSAPTVRVSAAGTGYLQFDLSVVPAGRTVARATLSLFPGRVTAPGAVSVHAVGAAWTEDTLTHDGRPAREEAPLASLAVPDAPSDAFLEADVTSAVQAWVNGEANFGLALVGDGTVDVDFVSKENMQTSRPPTLVLTLAAP